MQMKGAEWWTEKKSPAHTGWSRKVCHRVFVITSSYVCTVISLSPSVNLQRQRTMMEHNAIWISRLRIWSLVRRRTFNGRTLTLLCVMVTFWYKDITLVALWDSCDVGNVITIFERLMICRSSYKAAKPANCTSTWPFWPLWLLFAEWYKKLSASASHVFLGSLTGRALHWAPHRFYRRASSACS